MTPRMQTQSIDMKDYPDVVDKMVESYRARICQLSFSADVNIDEKGMMFANGRMQYFATEIGRQVAVQFINSTIGEYGPVRGEN